MMWHSTPGTKLLMALVAALVAPSQSPAQLRTHARQTAWLPSYDAAIAHARRENKVILAYFSGSDWDPYTQKLDKEVLNTDLFRQWAEQNVILLRIDFPRDKHLSGITKSQDEKLKQRYSISKVPTFVFIDPYGQPFVRAGYDEAKLRDEEHKGEPKAWIAFLQQTILKRPKEERINAQPGLTAALAFARSHFGSLLLMINKGHPETITTQRDALLKDQQFVKFVNENVAFVELDWPEDTDVSKEAESFRAFAAKHKLAPVPFQLDVLELPDTIKTRITGFSLDHVDRLINLIQAQLPHVDYNGGWIEDYHKARIIASQQDRFVFLAFTSMDGGEWSPKMQQEIFDTNEFKKYARKELVLVRLDFPTMTSQPPALAEQNKMLAEMYNVRGFPMVIVLNPLGQKLVESKYIRGGVARFLSQVEPILRDDKARRAALKED